MPPHLLRTAPNIEGLEGLIAKRAFPKDEELQLRVLEQVCLLAERERRHLFEIIGRRLGVDADRLIAVMELTDRVDRIKALSLPPDRTPQRLTDEYLFPTHGWFGDYLDWAGYTSAPLAWHFWSAASLISAAARRNLWVDAGMDEPVYLCNYYFIVGPSGSGKSTAIKKAQDILKRTNKILRQVGVEATHPHDPSIYTGPPSATLESWLDEITTFYADYHNDEPTMVLRPDCCCYIAQDEAVVLIGSDQHSAERWFNFFFQASDCPEEWRDSKVSARAAGHDRELYNVALTTLFGSAPEHLVQRVSSAIFSGGYIGRCVFSYRTTSGRQHSSRANTDPVLAERLAGTLAKIALRNPGRLKLTDEARDWYDDFLGENHQRIKECDPKFVGAYERAGWHTIKTAGVLALAEDPEAREITKDHVELAKELVELERPGSERIVGGTRTYDPVEQLNALERSIASPGQIDYATVLARSKGSYPMEDKLHQALQQLITSGRVRSFIPSENPKIMYSVQWEEITAEED